MEELLRRKDYDGIASLCEMEELQVRNIKMKLSPYTYIAIK